MSKLSGKCINQLKMAKYKKEKIDKKEIVFKNLFSLSVR